MNHLIESPGLTDANPEGICGCGCGGRTLTYARNDASRGYIEGHHRPYITGHNFRRAHECSVEGCKKRHCARGYCAAHWYLWRKYGATVAPPRAKNPETVCTVEGCERTGRKISDLCAMHHERLRKNGDVGPAHSLTGMVWGSTPEERFWARVKKTETCWLWTGGCMGGGYGHMGLNGKNISAHRFSYQLHVGPIPEGLHIDHLCRNPVCVNPEHLEAVTPRENNLRAVKYRTKAQPIRCINGHLLRSYTLHVDAESGRIQCLRCNPTLVRAR